MRRNWTVQRAGQAHPDGPRRWDRAYQRLLTAAPPQPTTPEPGVPRHPSQPEVAHEGGTVRAGVDRAASAGANH